MSLEITINRETCMGAGNCVFYCAGVFELDDEGVAVVLDPQANTEENLLLAARSCPTQSIAVYRDGEPLHVQA